MNPDSASQPTPAPSPPAVPGGGSPPANAAVPGPRGPNTALIIAVVVAFLLIVGGATVFAILKLAPAAQTALDRLREDKRAATAEQQQRRALGTSPSGAGGGSETVATESSPERAERIRALPAEISKQNAAVDNERVATALAQKHFIAIHIKTQAYEAAANALKSAGSRLSSGLTTKEAINARRELLKKWIAANDDLARSYSTLENDVRTEMEKTPSTRDGAAAAARTVARNANIDLALKYCDYDRQKGQKWLATLDLLQGTWGQWKIEPSGLVRFNSKQTLARFNELQKAITTADEAQLALQREPLGTASSSATPAPASNKPAGTR